MSGYVWDLSGTDKQCASYGPGHQVHWIHFNHSMREPSLVIPVTASVDDDGLVHIEGDDLSLVRWNHRPALVRAALQRFDGMADWKPRWHLLAVPTEAFMGSARTVFNLAAPGERRECCVPATTNPGPRIREPLSELNSRLSLRITAWYATARPRSYNERNCQKLWIEWFQATSDSAVVAEVSAASGVGDVGGPFEEFAFVEGGAGADKGDQMWGIDGPPAGLCGLDELVGHCQPGRARTRPLGHFRPQTYCGEGAFDRVGSPEGAPSVRGRPVNSNKVSTSSTILVTALGYFAPKSTSKALTATWALSMSSALKI